MLEKLQLQTCYVATLIEIVWLICFNLKKSYYWGWFS